MTPQVSAHKLCIYASENLLITLECEVFAGRTAHQKHTYARPRTHPHAHSFAPRTSLSSTNSSSFSHQAFAQKHSVPVPPADSPHRTTHPHTQSNASNASVDAPPRTVLWKPESDTQAQESTGAGTDDADGKERAQHTNRRTNSSGSRDSMDCYEDDNVSIHVNGLDLDREEFRSYMREWCNTVVFSRAATHLNECGDLVRDLGVGFVVYLLLSDITHVRGARARAHVCVVLCGVV